MKTVKQESSLFFKYILLPLLAGFVAMLLIGLVFSNTTATNRLSNIEIARELYQKVEKTKIAQIYNDEYLKAIENRMECYVKYHTYEDRVNICSSDYQKQIIRIASKTANKRPMIGKFVMKINECPVMFNMCRGQQKTVEECVVFEKKCIDFFLDKFWRGAWESSIKGN